MKIATVVGARPQFIKCGPVSRELRKRATEILVHTGQHYDDNMSGAFFRELDIPAPDHNLGVKSGPHGAQTGEMLRKLEQVVGAEKPDALLIYGDTNSTLAGALVGAKMHVPVAHVEAGLRSFNRAMPEEINRLVADALSTWLFCPTNTAVKNLAREGVTAGVHLVGDVMLDALLQGAQRAKERSVIRETLGLKERGYCLATVHRAENTDSTARLSAIVSALGTIGTGTPLVWPMHPRVNRALKAGGIAVSPSIRVIEPVPYLDMLSLQSGAAVILTDSGGIQKEASWLGVPCVTLRDETEWIETVERGDNVLAGADTRRITESADRMRNRGPRSSATSREEGGATGKIADILVKN